MATRDSEDSVDPSLDQTWVCHFDVTSDNRRAVEAMAALSNGSFGTRGLIGCAGPDAEPATVANGAYSSDALPALLVGPIWNKVDVGADAAHARGVSLDLGHGVVRGEVTGPHGSISAVEFVSRARPGIHVLQVTGPAGRLSAGRPLEAPAPQPDVTVTEQTEPPMTMTVTSTRAVIAAAASQLVDDVDGTRTVTRIAAFASDPAGQDTSPVVATSGARLTEAETIGFAGLLAEHEEAWSQTWGPVTIEVGAQPLLERQLRFAQFHLLSASKTGDESAIGARGLTGPGYRGHVFWDTDVFVVPALAAMVPERARAALRYRWHRLGASRRRAAAEGHQGARFAWESAQSGEEVTPTTGRDLHGRPTPIRTGQQEEHVVADVAWAVSNYLDWTADDSFLRSVGADILVDTARYWQSRVEIDDDGTGHLRGVIGPDEYHENVDDNTYTNVMARWNLRRAADVCERLAIGLDDKVAAWRHTADRLVDGFDSHSGVHEQFAGFFDLEPVTARTLGEPPLPADALLGRERIQQVQIIKQADVLMLHHLIPDEVTPDSLEADIAYYLPRTAHGSSLSPAITASVLARGAHLEAACHWFRLAARLDLDDLTRTTAGGIHLATMGGLWQAFTQGFLGVRPTPDGLLIDPKTPTDWTTITHRFIFQSAPVQVDASNEALTVTSPRPVTVLTPDGERRTGERITARLTSHGWEAS